MLSHKDFLAALIAVPLLVSAAPALEIGVSTPSATATVSIGKEGGSPSATASVELGSGGDWTGGNATDPTSPNGGGGTTLVGTDPTLMPAPSTSAALAIVGSSVWTSDGVLVGLVTEQQSRSPSGMVIVGVQTTQGFGFNQRMIRLQIIETAFGGGAVRLAQSHATLLDQIA